MALLVPIGTPQVLPAQSVVNGRVVSDSVRLPVPGAEVLLEELGTRAYTSDSGRFRLSGIPLGTYTLRVRRIGFQSALATLRVLAVDSVTIDVPLRPLIPELEPLIVTAEQSLTSRMREFDDRRRSGFLQVPVDGVRVADAGANLNLYPVQLLGAVEIYRRAAQAPIAFTATGTACGIVVIWTREQ